MQDPEALPDYPDHPGYPAHTILPYNLDQATQPDYPAQTVLPDHPDQTQTTLPDYYTDNLSPSAPPAEFATPSAAEIAAEEAAAAAHTTEAAASETAAALAAAAEDRLGENGCEAPPSYDAAMRGEF